ncbi:MAG: hypothetical protein WC599_04080 [Bacteroidales bacterium]
MKRSILLFLLCFSISIFSKAQKQCAIEIKSANINVNGQSKELTSNISDVLTEGVLKSFILYEDTQYRYGAEFKYFRSSNRLKLMHREYAIKKSSSKKIYRKWTEQVQFVKIAIQGEFTGSCGGNITVDKKNLEYLFLQSDYKVNYK